MMAMQRLQNYINHLRHIDELRQSIEFLLQGIITPQLLPKLTLRHTLLGIKSHLQRHFHNFHLVFDRAIEFYAMKNFHFVRHDKHLLIHLSVPITALNHEFLVFRVSTIPVPVTGQISHTTFVSDLPQYLVTSRHSSYYFTMDHDDSSNHHALLYTSGKDIVFKHFTSAPSCISALFQNDIIQARRLCTFVLREKSLEPHISFLDDGKILLSNITALALDCRPNSTHITLPGCVLCLRQLPCNCGLKIFSPNSSDPSFFWLPRLATCSHPGNLTKIDHVVNLASLQSFFDDSALGDLAGDTYLDSPLPVQLPAFRHFHHEFHRFMTSDIQRSHDLQKFSDRVKNKSLIFNDLSDILLHHLNDLAADNNDLLLSSQFTSATWWISWSTVICSYVSLFLAIFLCYKLKPLGSVFPLFSSISAAELSKFPPFLHFGDPPSQPLINVTDHVARVVDHTPIFTFDTVLLLASFTFVLLSIWFYRVYYNSHRLYIVLEIGNAHTCVRIRCLRLHSVLYAYEFTAPEYIESLSVMGCCVPHLVIKWTSFTAVHVLHRVSFTFPSKILITPWTKVRLSRILHSESFYALCLLEYRNNFRLLDFEARTPLSRDVTFLGEQSSPDHTTATVPPTRSDAVLVPVPTKLFPSMSNLHVNVTSNPDHEH